jgi:hypothetical protein
MQDGETSMSTDWYGKAACHSMLLNESASGSQQNHVRDHDFKILTIGFVL